jgi:hypothetical protein
MSDTVPCPECHQPARVLERFTVEREGVPNRYLRLQCDGPLTFIVALDDVEDETAVQADLERADGAA